MHRATLTAFEFHLFFGGNNHLEDAVLHPHGFDALFEVLFDLVFVARIGVNDIPGATIVGSFLRLWRFVLNLVMFLFGLLLRFQFFQFVHGAPSFPDLVVQACG